MTSKNDRISLSVHQQSHYCLLFVLDTAYHLLEGFLKQLIDVLASAGRSLIVFEPLFLGIADGFRGIDFLASRVALIADKHHHCIFEVEPVAPHRVLPLRQIIEALSIVEVKNQQHHLCISIERVTDLVIVTTATQVEKIDCHFSARNSDFFYTIIDSNSGDVFLDEAALAVALDDAAFAYSAISY